MFYNLKKYYIKKARYKIHTTKSEKVTNVLYTSTEESKTGRKHTKLCDYLRLVGCCVIYFQVLYFSDFLNFVLQVRMEMSFHESIFTMFINTFWMMTKACLGFANFYFHFLSFIYFFTLFSFTILYWFCHTLTASSLVAQW